MFGFIKKLFGSKAETTQAEECPYKVESKPVEDLADIAIAQRPTPVAEKATEAAVKSVANPAAKKAPAKKAPAKKTAPKKQGGNKPKKPKAPKAPKA